MFVEVMDEHKGMAGKGMSADKEKEKASSMKSGKSKKFRVDTNVQDQEVLLSLPGGFKYKLPGKRQRVIVGSLVLGLNLLLVAAVALYFYSPAFQEFIYNVGRD